MNVVHGEKSELHLAMTQQHAAEKQGTVALSTAMKTGLCVPRAFSPDPNMEHAKSNYTLKKFRENNQ